MLCELPASAPTLQQQTAAHAFATLAAAIPVVLPGVAVAGAGSLTIVVGLATGDGCHWLSDEPHGTPPPPEASRLPSLPNSAQAYVIAPVGSVRPNFKPAILLRHRSRSHSWNGPRAR